MDRAEEALLIGTGLQEAHSLFLRSVDFHPSIAFESTTFKKKLFVDYLISVAEGVEEALLKGTGLQETQVKSSIGILFRFVGDLKLDLLSIVPLFSGALE